MARIEKKSISVRPDEEQAAIDVSTKFGWSLVSTQEIFTQATRFQTVGKTNYNYLDTTNYVKLLFERDKDMPNYKELAALELEFDIIKNSAPQKGKVTFGEIVSWFWIVVGVISVFVFLIVSLFEGASILLAGLLAALIMVVPSVIYLRTKHKRDEAIFAEEYLNWESQMADLMKRVEVYCD